ncbi:MAG: D-alanyl-D-alanine carboxypeptidase [Eubacteriales bacterium]|nr:D-alanyl-D-alanine carboxypeptidase [Eubacteriales bacterium]
MKKRSFKRIAALAAVFALVFSNLAYADNVILADRPYFGQQAGSSQATPQGSTQGMQQGQTYGPGGTSTQNNNQTGPGGSMGDTSANVGPGGTNNQTGPGTGTQTNNNQGMVNGVESQSAGQINVDERIEKPTVTGEAAVLMDAKTGQVLYSKNAEKAMYPASTTKLMTALLAVENLSLDDTITFSSSAVNNLESGAVTVQMAAGDTMTVRDALYALMVKSACEVANGLAEKVSGSQSAFAEAMTAKAKALGAKNTNFRNASGLNDQSHYSCAYDLALITRAAFAKDSIKKIAGTISYTLPASKNRGRLTITTTNKMLISGNAEYLSCVIGGKTGYTSKAGNTLVEVAEINGYTLIAVTLKSTNKFNDAKLLFDYGNRLIEGNGSTGSQPQQQGKWEQTADGWKYKKADGKYVVSDWMDIGENEYYFGSDGIMATGWRQFTNGAWYYFDEQSGAMVHDKWVSPDSKKYYYLQSNGVMATNTIINGIYRVNADGVYVEKVG